MSLRERNGHWHYRFDLHGQEYSGSTGLIATEGNRAGADAIEQQNRAFIAEREAARHSRTLTPMMYEHASARWLEATKAVYQQHPNTWIRHTVSNTALKAAFGDRLVYAIRAADLVNFIHARLKDGRKPVTVRNDLNALSKFFAYAEVQGWCHGNPVRNVKMPSGSPEPRMYVLSAERERKYFEAARTSPTLHDYARLILLTGMRPDEVLRIRIGDWDGEAGTVRITHGKTRAARRVLKLVPEAQAIIERRVGLRGPDAFLFAGERPGRPATKMNNPHVRACKRAGIRFRLYDLRHTFATRAAAKGMPLTTLAAILGHSGLRCVLCYVHPGQADMDAAMLKFGAA